MRKRRDYWELFGEDDGRSLAALTGELHELMAAAHPPDAPYRENLRKRLLAAARDERFYHRGVSRRLVLAMTIVLSVLVSVIGVIAWRSLEERAHGA